MELSSVKNLQRELKGKKVFWIAEELNNDQFRGFIEKIDSQFGDGDIIYSDRNILVNFQAEETNGIKKNIVAKKFNLTRIYDQFRFRFLNSKAVRSLIIATVLKEIGINTPSPVAVVEKRGKGNKIIYSYYLTEYIPYDYSLLDIIKQKNHPYQDKVLHFLPLIARDVRKMHDAGIIHNDLHAGNILINNINQDPEFYYIDLNRARIKKKLNRKKRLKDLARFDFSLREQEIFLQHYAPEKHQELLDLLVRMRSRRKMVIKWKRKLKGIFN